MDSGQYVGAAQIQTHRNVALKKFTTTNIAVGVKVIVNDVLEY
jgi:hypothetical protein